MPSFGSRSSVNTSTSYDGHDQEVVLVTPHGSRAFMPDGAGVAQHDAAAASGMEVDLDMAVAQVEMRNQGKQSDQGGHGGV